MNYFANDWEAVASAPDDAFASPPIEDVVERAGSWVLPESIHSIVRIQHPETLKVTEKVFKTHSRAESYKAKQEAAGFYVTAYTDASLYYSPGFAALGYSFEDD